MKYMLTVFEMYDGTYLNITTTEDGVVFHNVSVEPGNPNYENFLTQAELTDKQVHALKPDVWYDFPNGDK
jgi:hypothetical protein